MQPNDVDKLLKEYRTNKARYETLILTAERTQRLLQAEADSALANDALHAQQYKDTPHGNKVSKPVEDLVLRYMDGYMPDTMRDWMAEGAAVQGELMELKTDIRYVDAWLGALNDRERIVITEAVINDRSMRELSLHSHKMFAYPLSADAIRGIKRSALKKIYDIAR